MVVLGVRSFKGKRAMNRFDGHYLRDARIAAGLRPEQVALAIGKSVYTIHSYECGRVTPAADTIAALSRLLGVSADRLLGLEVASAVA